ncbi:hypothetical protein GMI70_04555 [Eggerthellaceae bacterium zg-893]|nr:hypothetical protein [Eggerthellaceae bacterium zg-893]
MTRIAPVYTAFNPKVLWFDAKDLDLSSGQPVVVSTARGLEYGHLSADVFEATRDQLRSLKSPLRPVERAATPEDEEQARSMEALSREALPVFKEYAAETNDDMRPVSVEFLFDGDKAVFYFESEERVDFRELVKKLAARFRVRIDMRQIGVRDEARMIGGLGHCGQELCCKRLGGEFSPVSIRMAKEQDLSLNPQKISGLCGRLMCCLRYEYEAYRDFKGRSPKMNATIETPEGEARVVDLDVPREVVSLKVGPEKPVRVPLGDFDAPSEGTARPNCVGREAWERAQAESTWGPMATNFTDANLASSRLTGEDKLGRPQATHNESRKGRPSKSAKGSERSSDKQARSSRGRKDRAQGGGASKRGQGGAPETKSTRKPRRSRKLETHGAEGAVQTSPSDAKKQASGAQKASKQASSRDRRKEGRADKTPDRNQRVRPGQKSSGLRAQGQAGEGAKGAGQAAPKKSGPKQGQGASEGRRRRSPRRSHKSGSKPASEGAQTDGAAS